MADIDDLQRRQADAAQFAMKMVDEKDPEKLKEMAEQLQERCKELQKTAKGIEAGFDAGGSLGPETHVTLTADQKKRIVELTGVGIETVILHDSKQRMYSKEMPRIEPREIERLAAAQAAETKLVTETRTQVEKIIKQLEALNVPELADAIADLKKDPTLGRGKKKP